MVEFTALKSQEHRGHRFLGEYNDQLNSLGWLDRGSRKKVRERERKSRGVRKKKGRRIVVYRLKGKKPRPGRLKTV